MPQYGNIITAFDSNNEMIAKDINEEKYWIVPEVLSHIILDSRAQQIYSMDAYGAVNFARSLELMKTEMYNAKFADLMARILFDASYSSSAYADSVVRRGFKTTGKTGARSVIGDDVPVVSVAGEENIRAVYEIPISFSFSDHEILTAAHTQVPLNSLLSNAANRTIEEALNRIVFFGETGTSLVGLFQDTNIVKTAVKTVGSATKFKDKTPDQILDDINTLMSGIFSSTKTVEKPNKLVLPPAQWSLINTTQISSGSDMTIAKYIVANSPYLKSSNDIIACNEFEATNNPLSSTDIMFAYSKNKMNSAIEITQEKTMRPPVRKLAGWVVLISLRFAGLINSYPKSMRMATGI